jgi:hypothetical protein
MQKEYTARWEKLELLCDISEQRLMPGQKRKEFARKGAQLHRRQ